MAFDRPARLIVAGAESRAIREDANDSHGHSAGKCEQKASPAWLSADRAFDKPGAVEQDAAEKAASQSACYAADNRGEPIAGPGNHSRGGAKIGVVSREPKRGKPRYDDRIEHKPVRALLERAAHLLDCEDDACERRIESGGDTGGRAGEDQSALMAQAAQVRHLHHHCSSNLHCRAFAANRCPGKKAQKREPDLSYDQPRRHQAAPLDGMAKVAGGDGLRNAAALRAGEVFLREKCGKEKTGRRYDKGKPPCPPQCRAKCALAPIGGLCEENAE